MADPYRKGKIADYIQRLVWRKEDMMKQMELPEFADIRQNMAGQIQALDTVVRELVREFEIKEDDFK